MSKSSNGGRVTAKGTRPRGTSTGQPSLQDLAARAMAVQDQVAKAKARAAEAVVTGTAAGGKVQVLMHGDGSPAGIEIDPATAAAEYDMLGDLLLVAWRDAWLQAQALQDSETAEHLDAIGGIDLRAMGLDRIL